MKIENFDRAKELFTIKTRIDKEIELLDSATKKIRLTLTADSNSDGSYDCFRSTRFEDLHSLGRDFPLKVKDELLKILRGINTEIEDKIKSL